MAILRSVVCSLMNIATESNVELCEHSGKLSSLSSRYCTAVNKIQESSRAFKLHWSVKHKDKYIIDIAVIGTSPCVTISFVSQSKLSMYISESMHIVYCHCH